MHSLIATTTLLLTLGMTLGTEASFAGDLVACEPPASIELRATDCVDNPLYSQAGQRCVNSLLGAVQTETAHAARVIDRNDRAALGDGKNRQAGNLGAANGDYGTAGTSLQLLLKEAARTQEVLERYRAGMVLPFDCGGDCAPYEDAIWSHHCYADHADSLEKMIKKVEGIRADLAAAQKQNLMLFGDTGTRRANLEGSVGGVVSSTHAVGGALVGGKSRNGASTITGKIPPTKSPIHP